MKTLSVSVEDTVWQRASNAAAAKNTTLHQMVEGFVMQVAQTGPLNEEEDRKNREALVEALRNCGAVVGERPTRERTYSDRRFHRH
jgi:antitoxin component of RelBE/YafQ-DinJ toxin-antitoxin module